MPREQRPVAIVKLAAGDGSGAFYQWRTDDQAPDDFRLLSGRATLREGKDASSLDIEVPDPRLELANSLPLPYKTSSKRIPIEAWFGFAPRLTKIFAGYYTGFRSSGLPGRISLTAVDKSKGTRRVQKSRNLTSATPAQLIRTLAKEAELAVDLSAAPELETVQFSGVLQMGETDAEVLTRVLEGAGYAWRTRGDTIVVQPLGATQTKRVEVRMGQNVANGFSIDVDELTRATTPNVYDIDGSVTYDDQGAGLDAEALERATKLDRTGLTIATEVSPSYSKQAEERALKAQARAKEVFKASVPLTEAIPDVDVDHHAVLFGFGARFNGIWNISEVEHDLKVGRTSLEIYNGGSSV